MVDALVENQHTPRVKTKPSQSVRSLPRRKFLKHTAATGVLTATTALGAHANSKIQLGLVGCGQRGVWLADLFKASGHFEIIGVADYFKDRTDAAVTKLGVPAKSAFTGLDAYKKMIAAGNMDAIAIVSPPYFHPQQAAAAVEAGLHTWVAKPVAVDVPGCQSIEASGRKASQNSRVFLVDFQTRADPYFQEAVKRVHAGAIGDFAFGESYYHAGRLQKQAEPGNPEATLRNWVFDKKLSGDIITEQNIHTLDVMSWIMNTPPVRATGTGGRKVRVDVGDCWDHFVLSFEYPNNVGITFSSRQFDAHGSVPDGIVNRMFGTRGVLETKYGGNVMIRGDAYYRGGKSPRIYEDGVKANIETFYEAIITNNFSNTTVAPSVQSNLVTILGRTAAYSGQTVTWDDLLKETKREEADLSGLQA